MDVSSEKTQFWVSQVTMAYVSSFFASIGLDEEDPAYIATKRLSASVSDGSSSEISFVVHKDKKKDNQDCNMYDHDGFLLGEPFDILIDDATLERSEQSCRNIKQVIHYGLTFGARIASLERALNLAGYYPSTPGLHIATVASAQAQANAIYGDAKLEFISPETLDQIKSGAKVIDENWGDSAVQIDCFDPGITYIEDSASAKVSALDTICQSLPTRISTDAMLSAAAHQIMNDVQTVGIVAIGTQGELVYVDDERHVLERREISEANNSSFTPRNFWKLIADYQVSRDDLPDFLFE